MAIVFEKCICLVCLGGPRRPLKLFPSVVRVSAFCLLVTARCCQNGATLEGRLDYRHFRETYGRSVEHFGGQAVASGFCLLFNCFNIGFYRL